MATLQKVKINDHCEITSSKRIFSHEYLNSGVPFYRGKEISEKQRSSDEVNNQIFISRDKFEELKSKHGAPEKGDLLLTSVGTIGNPYLVKEGEEFYFKDGNLTWFKNFKDLNSQWLYYWLLSPQGKSELNKCTIGASQKAYTINLLEGMEIDLLPMQTQTRIASVLSTYDDLIENNEKRIRVLEELAQRLYTEWFINFNFPAHICHPELVSGSNKSIGYKDAGGKMIDSGTAYGKIPIGWDVVTFGSLLSGVKRKTKIQTNRYLSIGKYPIVDQSRVFITGYTDSEDAVYYQNLVVFGDHSRCFKYCNFPFACGADGTQLLLTNDSERMPEILLYYVSLNSGLQNYNYARHFKFLKSLHVIKPDVLIARKFATFVDEAYLQIRALRDKNITLSKIRDLLIPQLVTGKRQIYSL